MKLRRLKEIVDEVVEKAGETDPRVIFYTDDDNELFVKSIGHFQLVTDLVFTLTDDEKNLKRRRWGTKAKRI